MRLCKLFTYSFVVVLSELFCRQLLHSMRAFTYAFSSVPLGLLQMVHLRHHAWINAA